LSNDDIWLGTDDGRVSVTRDAGAHWQDVTPPDLPAWAKVSTVDVSALDPGTAYVAVDNHRADDFRPMAWRTHDYGKTWTAIANGLPAGHFVGALRADTAKRGLLFAGTDQGVWVSFDDGGQWQSLQRNLPNAIVTDLLVHGDDLIVATQGRSIWVMDQLAPLRQLDASVVAEPARLFQPGKAIRVHGNQNKDTPLPREEPAGRNPEDGAVFDYWLARDARGPVTLSVLDASGTLLRRFVSDEKRKELPSERYFEERWLGTPQELSGKAGAHRFVWNLRGTRPVTGGYDFSIAAIDGEEATLLPQGMLVAPGHYQVVLKANGREYKSDLDVVADPRVALDTQALAAASAMSKDVTAAMDRQFVAAGEATAVQKQLDALKDKPAVAAALAAFKSSIGPMVEGSGEQATLNLGFIGGQLSSLQTDLEGSDRAPTQPQRDVYAEYSGRLERALVAWAAIKSDELPKLNGTLTKAGLKPITLPTRAQIPVTDVGSFRERP
jgi:hypothetical protein